MAKTTQATPLPALDVARTMQPVQDTGTFKMMKSLQAQITAMSSRIICAERSRTLSRTGSGAGKAPAARTEASVEGSAHLFYAPRFAVLTCDARSSHDEQCGSVAKAVKAEKAEKARAGVAACEESATREIKKETDEKAAKKKKKNEGLPRVQKQSHTFGPVTRIDNMGPACIRTSRSHHHPPSSGGQRHILLGTWTFLGMLPSQHGRSACIIRPQQPPGIKRQRNAAKQLMRVRSGSVHAAYSYATGSRPV